MATLFGQLTRALLCMALVTGAAYAQQYPARLDMKERVVGLGFDIVASTPEQFAAQIKVEVAKWAKVVKSAGVKVE